MIGYRPKTETLAFVSVGEQIGVSPCFLSKPWAHFFLERAEETLHKFPAKTNGYLRRLRALRFGWSYESEPKKLDEGERSWPLWLQVMGRIVSEAVGGDSSRLFFDAVTVNEYPPWGLIDPHEDVDAFEREIAVVSLGGTSMFNVHRRREREGQSEILGREITEPVEKSVELAHGSLLVMRGPVRHSCVNGRERTRVSVVWRRKRGSDGKRGSDEKR